MSEPVKSAGIVIVKNRETEPLYLMLCCRGYWDFPKGKVDPGETQFMAALRETEEESSLKDIKFPWGGIFEETEPYPTKVDGKKVKKVSRYYIGEFISGEVELRPNPISGVIEHDKYRWISSSQVSGVELSPRIKKIFDWAASIVEA